MNLRTFTAPDIPTAMHMVRENLGEDAVILSLERKNGRHSVSITAATDRQDDDLPATAAAEKSNGVVYKAENNDELRFEAQNILRYHNLPELFVAKLMQQASDRTLAAATALHRISGNRDVRHLYRLTLEKLAASAFAFDPLPFEETNFRIMLVGAPGAGKTLTIAKMAARLAMDGQPLTVITTDNKRAGGVEQLEAFTRILGLELKQATSRDDLARHLKTRHARVLIDTAGCNPLSDTDMKELRSYLLDGVEPVLTMPAGGDSMEAVDIAESFATLPVKRLLVTRVDTARRFGGALSVVLSQGLSFCNASHSPSIIDTLQPVDAAKLAEFLIRYQLQSYT